MDRRDRRRAATSSHAGASPAGSSIRGQGVVRGTPGCQLGRAGAVPADRSISFAPLSERLGPCLPSKREAFDSPAVLRFLCLIARVAQRQRRCAQTASSAGSNPAPGTAAWARSTTAVQPHDKRQTRGSIPPAPTNVRFHGEAVGTERCLASSAARVQLPHSPPAVVTCPRSPTGHGRRPPKAEVAGSNPAGDTTFNQPFARRARADG